MVLNLLMKASVINFKIYDYTEEDMRIIKELYERGIFTQYEVQNFFNKSCTCWVDIYSFNWQKLLKD